MKNNPKSNEKFTFTSLNPLPLPESLPVKPCCRAIENAWNMDMIGIRKQPNFNHFNQLNQQQPYQPYMSWKSITYNSQCLSLTCVFCGKILKFK